MNVSKNTIVYSGFPGIGKSYFYKHSKLKVLDSDSSKFDKTLFPQNYIDHIKNNIGKVDIILISSHDVVRNALVQNGITFTLVYPNIDLKEEYLCRYKVRANNNTFIQLLYSNWDMWILQLQKQIGCSKIELDSNQYLSDVCSSE